ncbi:Protein yqjC precursor [hydrothermal vent metagenome]|uniref:Protein yqjC n=1 Tax=hydrothermal vent metagenome TaxID=652676 RepID=A0A1W1CAK7_9ZZZZ
MKSSGLFALVAVVGMGSMAYADDCSALAGCAKKECEINKQLNIAKSVNNTGETARLSMVLEKVKATCTEESVDAKDERKTEKIEKKIAEKKEDIAEHQEDLAEAKAKGKSEKVMKYQHKIEEDQAKIKRLENELSTH